MNSARGVFCLKQLHFRRNSSYNQHFCSHAVSTVHASIESNLNYNDRIFWAHCLNRVVFMMIKSVYPLEWWCDLVGCTLYWHWIVAQTPLNQIPWYAPTENKKTRSELNLLDNFGLRDPDYAYHYKWLMQYVSQDLWIILFTHHFQNKY